MACMSDVSCLHCSCLSQVMHITAIGAAELDASLEAVESFEEFIRAEYQDELIHYPPAVTMGSTDNNDIDGQYNIPLDNQSREQDRFLESINWDEVLNN